MRLEYKYLVPNELLARLRSDLSPFFVEDKFASRRGLKEYTVRSIYFDTVGLDNYHEKMEGLRVRKKVRVRGYDQLSDQSVVFLEVKKKFQDFGYKNRFPMKYCHLEVLLRTRNVEGLLSESNGSVDEARRFLFQVEMRSLRPVILISYEREAFFCKFQPALRITFDRNIRSQPFPSLGNLFDEHDLHFARPGDFVLEVKFSKGFPTWLRDVITRHRLKQMSVSKYTISLDSHRMMKKPLNRNKVIGFASPYTQDLALI